MIYPKRILSSTCDSTISNNHCRFGVEFVVSPQTPSLPLKPRQSRSSREQLVYLRLEVEGIRLLPVSSRREVARAIESSPGVDSVAISGSSVLIVLPRSSFYTF